jgi:hypothetical protein
LATINAAMKEEPMDIKRTPTAEAGTPGTISMEEYLTRTHSWSNSGSSSTGRKAKEIVSVVF